MLNYPQRKSPRLPKYDYAQNGLYFVTICVEHRLDLLGIIVEATMKCNAAGEMIGNWWLELAKKYAGVAPMDFVVMPNHFHGIIVIDNPTPAAAHLVSLSAIIQWFKTMTTNAYLRGVREAGWPTVEGKLWQRSYHDHIIRDEIAFENIRRYIQENPAKWGQDVFYHAQ